MAGAVGAQKDYTWLFYVDNKLLNVTIIKENNQCF
jgi:hypothetical protein